MACRICGDSTPVRIGSYPAGNPRSLGCADYVAATDRAHTGVDTHVHYQPRGDQYVVVRPPAAKAVT
jgi:hypothetical protein